MARMELTPSGHQRRVLLLITSRVDLSSFWNARGVSWAQPLDTPVSL